MSCPISCHECSVWKKSLFKDFDSHLIEWLSQKKKPQTIFKSETYFKQGEEVTGIYCHFEGLSKVIQKDSKDKIRFTRLVFPGDTSGHRSLFIQNTYQGTTIALSDEVSACFISTEDILFLLSKNSSFAKNLIVKISRELNRSEEDMMATKEKTVRGRLAQLVYNLAVEYSDKMDNGNYVIKTEITKRELAKLLLVADETVIRLMSEMMKEEIIMYSEKKLIIKDLSQVLELTKY